MHPVSYAGVSPDVVMVGAGHNGLVAALLLARQGLTVHVVEEKATVGGAAKTEYPFQSVPRLGTSTGAYLLGLMPPELIQLLGIDLPLIRRDPHYFLPTTDRRYLLLGSDRTAAHQQFIQFFSEQDWRADQALQTELDQLRHDIAPAWLAAPLSLEETAERYVRPGLRQIFLDLCRQSVGQYLERFEFKSDLIKAMYAVTDGCAGLLGTWDTPGTGMNFLIHNMVRLPGSDGTWMIVRGGMGTVTQTLAQACRQAGVTIETDCPIQQILVSQGQVTGVVSQDGRELQAKTVVVNADPFRMRRLVGGEQLTPEYNARLDQVQRPGSSFKVNLCLKGLPRFTCLPEVQGQHSTTIHLLPDESVVLAEMRRAFDQASRGELPDFPTIEWYMHSPLDSSLQDPEGHHNAALFVQWVPYQLRDTSWEAAEADYVQHLLGICDRFAPDTSSLVQEVFALSPPKIEQHFGITGGHVHHIDNTWGFADRLPYRTPIAGLYSVSAACHPGGSVIGAAGYNAAQQILQDLEWPKA